jgi:GT2 family glycosyltransferase
MALISMAVHDTEENNRTELTRRTIESIKPSIKKGGHRLIIIDNGSCEATKELLRVEYNLACLPDQRYNLSIITNEENIGTAKAINKGWKFRKPGENVVKMDNDVVIHDIEWITKLEEAIAREPKIGIIGLKRKDLAEHPNYPEGHHYKSKILMLPHTPGETWIFVEEVKHVMGTCQMYSSALIDKIGGLYQMDGIYGFDDSLASVRCTMAGFKNVFLPHINIDHIDPGVDQYSEWKREYAGEQMELFGKVKAEYISGERSIYYPL